MMSIDDAKQFARDWLALLDRLAPVEDYLKYLPDGDFEQWSYPEVDIRNVEHLKAFFAKTWGMVTSQSNSITSLNASPDADGRVVLDILVDWHATLAQGQQVSRPLRYRMTVGEGACAADPNGAFPKVYRYSMTRPAQ